MKESRLNTVHKEVPSRSLCTVFARTRNEGKITDVAAGKEGKADL